MVKAGPPAASARLADAHRRGAPTSDARTPQKVRLRKRNARGARHRGDLGLDNAGFPALLRNVIAGWPEAREDIALVDTAFDGADGAVRRIGFRFDPFGG
jgi:hypothetical protein